jgi:glutathione peroxidase-family protein
MLQQCAKSCAEHKTAEAIIKEKVGKVGSFYDLKGRDIDGKTVNFSDFKGRVVVLVNVASECGYTESHYRGLVELFEEVGGKGGAEILAFPCNQFGSQEPGTAKEIKAFAKSKGVKFRMMEKVDVNGADADLIYLYLKDQAGITSITWNFATYFVVSPEGDIESYTGVEPMELSNIIQLLQKDEL